MTLFQDLNKRIARADFTQISLLFFAILVLSFMLSWPVHPQDANDIFFVVAQARLLLLVLLALGYGSFLATEARNVQRLSALALALLAIVSIPIELTAHSMSLPAIPVYWSFLLSLINTFAFFGIGIVLGFSLGKLRLRGILPLMVPSVLGGVIAMDIVLGIPLFNPLAALTTVNLGHLFLMTVLATLCLSYLFYPLRERHD